MIVFGHTPLTNFESGRICNRKPPKGREIEYSGLCHATIGIFVNTAVSGNDRAAK